MTDGINQRKMQDSFYQFKRAIYFLRQRGAKAFISKIIEISQSGEVIKLFQSSQPPVDNSSPTKKPMKSLYLAANDVTWVSNDYRGRNFSDALNELGMEHIYLDHYHYLTSEEAQKNTKNLILFRTDSRKSAYLNLDEKSTVIYDSDDLCFDRRYFNHANVPGIRATTRKNQDWLLGGSLDGQEDIVRNSFVGTGPTDRIVQSMLDIGAEHALVLDNVLPKWMHQQAIEFRGKSAKSKEQLKILYASGSNTHQEDFMVAWPGIRSFLEKNTGASLTFLGYLPIEVSEFGEVSNQIKFVHKVSHRELIPFHASFDLAIAPLAINEFTQAKSALKFVHAAALGIPCLATPSSPFVVACSSRFPDFLVEEENWFESLENLRDRISEGINLDLIDEYEQNWTMEKFRNQVSKLIDLAAL